MSARDEQTGPAEPLLTLTQGQLVKLVNDAALAAAERITSRYRLKLAFWAFLAGALASSAIAIPVTLIVSHDAAASAARQANLNASANCRNISSLATIEETTYRESALQTRAFAQKSSDRFGLTKEQFAQLIAANERREQIRVAKLQAIAASECGAKVQTPETRISTTPSKKPGTTTKPSSSTRTSKPGH